MAQPYHTRVTANSPKHVYIYIYIYFLGAQSTQHKTQGCEVSSKANSRAHADWYTKKPSVPILGFPSARLRQHTKLMHPITANQCIPNQAYLGLRAKLGPKHHPALSATTIIRKRMKAQGKSYYMCRSLLMLRTHERFKHALERLELLEQRL